MACDLHGGAHGHRHWPARRCAWLTSRKLSIKEEVAGPSFRQQSVRPAGFEPATKGSMSRPISAECPRNGLLYRAISNTLLLIDGLGLDSRALPVKGGPQRVAELVHVSQAFGLAMGNASDRRPRRFLPIHVYETATSRPAAVLLRPRKTPS